MQTSPKLLSQSPREVSISKQANAHVFIFILFLSTAR
jgi:hypothetical protein